MIDAVLIHGWDATYYNSKIKPGEGEDIAWSHRAELINELSKHFKLKYYNLPGFAGNPEPKLSEYNVENFASDFHEWLIKIPEKPQLIIGYSFGGAVALMYKAITKDPIPTVLISPAIFRGESLKSGIGKNANKIIPTNLKDRLRHFYQLLMSKYYREGTPFLRNTYNQIVRRDLRKLLREVDSKSLFLIYGGKDLDTPWSLVKEYVIKNKIGHHLIESGGHNIGQTHPREIVEQIIDLI